MKPSDFYEAEMPVMPVMQERQQQVLIRHIDKYIELMEDEMQRLYLKDSDEGDVLDCVHGLFGDYLLDKHEEVPNEFSHALIDFTRMCIDATVRHGATVRDGGAVMELMPLYFRTKHHKVLNAEVETLVGIFFDHLTMREHDEADTSQVVTFSVERFVNNLRAKGYTVDDVFRRAITEYVIMSIVSVMV